MIKFKFVLFVVLFTNGVDCLSEDYCFKNELCSSTTSEFRKPRFLLYDINYPEGFNLRRDVFMRLAIFIYTLKTQGHNWYLVLPPWHHLYHWKSNDIGSQSMLPWRTFFDLDSMKRFAPVMEFEDFLDELKDAKLDKIFYLHHYKDAFSSSNWEWNNQWNFTDCDHNIACKDTNCAGSSYIYDGTTYHGWFWGYKNISSLSVQCVSFQGPASLLKEIMDNNPSTSSIMVDHAEVVIHDTFGDTIYWKCRRSMRFSKDLTDEARNFRLNILGSNDTKDGTHRPDKWENEKAKRTAEGGPYLCAHLRRGDFLYGRSNQVPSMEYAAKQLNRTLRDMKLKAVFISTDASIDDVKLLKSYLKQAKVYQYRPDLNVRRKIKDGGVAIVDQIICSYARYFIGTHESTFTFRIQEEREIIGFRKATTYNLFCASPEQCFESSKWTIVY